MILAAFVTPALFYVGSAAVGVPILIHLLSRRRFKRVRWAATEFLLQAERQNRRRVRFEQWILLALRCLAVLLLALLVSRPFFQPSGIAALIGAQQRHERFIILDDSFSMSARSGNQTAFQVATRRIVNLLDWFSEQSPNDRVTILLAGEPDAPLAAGRYLDDLGVQVMTESLESATVSEGAFPLEAAILAVRDQLRSSSDAGGALVYLVSDFRRPDWQTVSGTSLAQALRLLTEEDPERHSVRVLFVDVGSGVERNLAISDVRATHGRAVAGATARFEFVIANSGSDPVEDVELRLYVDDAAQPGKKIARVGPSDELRVPVDVAFFQPGPSVLRAEIDVRDALSVDDNRQIGVTVVSASRILLVNGQPDPDSFLDEVALLRTALRPEGEIFSGNELEVIEEEDLDQTDLEPFDLVVMANVASLGEATVRRIESYVSAGGGVIFFLGTLVDVGSYNDLLYNEGKGLLPLELDEPVLVPDSQAGVGIHTEDLTHPMVRAFSGVRRLLGEPVFRGFFATRPPADESATSQPVLDLAPAQPDTQPSQTQTVQIALRLNDEAQSPLIAERTFGQGRVALVTTSADRQWHNWPESASYPVLILELASFVSRWEDRARLNVLVGAPIEFPLAPDRYEPEAKVRGPDYPATAEMNVRAEPAADNSESVVRWDRTDRSGVYQFHLRRRDGASQVRLAAVNLDARESDLTRVSPQTLRESLAGLEYEFVGEEEKREIERTDARSEFWPAILAGVFLVLMVEQFLAWRFGRRT